MGRARANVIALISLLVLFSVVAAPWTAVAQGTAGFVPVEALRRGGYVFLVRHAATVVKAEPSPLDLGNCEVQISLSDSGRADARTIGQAIATLSIPTGRVLASPYCRTLETARLAFGRAEPLADLLPASYVPVAGANVPPAFAQRVQNVRRTLATPQPTGANLVLVTHGDIASAVAGVTVAQGEVAVYRTDGRGGVVLVARILPAHWAAAAR